MCRSCKPWGLREVGAPHLGHQKPSATSASDFITNANVQTLSGSLNAVLAEGESVQVSLNAGILPLQ